MIDDDRSRQLLAEVFPHDPRFSSADYLHWLYSSPAGEVVAANQDEGSTRIGHYAVVPQQWRTPAGAEVPLALSLNTAVHPSAQGRGLFTTLAQQTYLAAAQRGIAGVVGVANANSTPGFIKRLTFRMVAPLPARICLPRPVRRLPDNVDVDRALLEGPQLARLCKGVHAAGGRGWEQVWDLERLRWRLAAPNRSFALHVDDDALAVSTRTVVRGVPVAALLGVLPRHGGSLDGRRYVAAACRRHRAPAAIHAGWAPQVRGLSGLPVPQRLRPSPLNFIVRSLDDRLDAPRFGLGRFEFLDFDAY